MSTPTSRFCSGRNFHRLTSSTAAFLPRKRKLLENWSGNDFCMGEDVRAVVFGGKKSLHIDDPIQLEMVRVLIQSDS